MNYQLIIGRQEDGHYGDTDKDVIRYRGRLDYVQGLDIPDIETAHKITVLCNIKSYQIVEAVWGNKPPVFTTPDITAWNTAEQAKREKNIKDNTELCVRINKLPTSYPYGTIAGHTITFERGEATYDPRRSGKIEWGLSILFLKIGTKRNNNWWDNLYPSKYRSTGYGKGRKRLHKRFEQDFHNIITDQAERDKLWDELPKIEARYEELNHQIDNA